MEIATTTEEHTMTTTTTHDLYDYDTSERIGTATPEQIAACDAAGEAGAILIDADGDVIAQGSWDAQQPGVRTVYTMPA